MSLADLLLQRKLNIIREKLEVAEKRVTDALDTKFEDVRVMVKELEQWLVWSDQTLRGFKDTVDDVAADVAVLQDIHRENAVKVESDEVSQVVCKSDDFISVSHEKGCNLTLRSDEFSLTDNRPDILILQGKQKLKYRNEEILIRFGLAWDFDCTVILAVCFPKREGLGGTLFYSTFGFTVEIPDSEGNPALATHFEVDPSDGTCIFPTGASELDHLTCSNTTHVEQLFTSSGDLMEFKKRLVCCKTNTTSAYSLAVKVEICPEEVQLSESLENAAEKDLKATSPEIRTVANPFRVISTKAESDEPAVKPLLAMPRFARVRCGNSVVAGCEKENLTAPKPKMDEKRWKLSKAAVEAYDSWIAGTGLSRWADVVDVNIELLHFAHHFSLPQLIEEVMSNLKSTPTEKYSPQSVSDLIVAAGIYRFNPSELLRRVGNIVVSNWGMI